MKQLDIVLQATQRETAERVIEAMRKQGLTEASVVFFEPFVDADGYAESELFRMPVFLYSDQPLPALKHLLRVKFAQRGGYPGATYRKALRSA